MGRETRRVYFLTVYHHVPVISAYQLELWELKWEYLTCVCDWMRSTPLTEPEKYSCYALFCFRATTSSLWHLAVIRGKPWIPQISTVNSNHWILPSLPHTQQRLLRSSWTIHRLWWDAWGLFILPIASICNANDWVSFSHYQGEVVACSLCHSVHISVLYTNLCLFPRFFAALQLRRHDIWSFAKAVVKRSCVSQLYAECGTVLTETVIWKTTGSILWRCFKGYCPFSHQKYTENSIGDWNQTICSL